MDKLPSIHQIGLHVDVAVATFSLVCWAAIWCDRRYGSHWLARVAEQSQPTTCRGGIDGWGCMAWYMAGWSIDTESSLCSHLYLVNCKVVIPLKSLRRYQQQLDSKHCNIWLR